MVMEPLAVARELAGDLEQFFRFDLLHDRFVPNAHFDVIP